MSQSWLPWMFLTHTTRSLTSQTEPKRLDNQDLALKPPSLPDSLRHLRDIHTWRESSAVILHICIALHWSSQGRKRCRSRWADPEPRLIALSQVHQERVMPWQEHPRKKGEAISREASSRWLGRTSSKPMGRNTIYFIKISRAMRIVQKFNWTKSCAWTGLSRSWEKCAIKSPQNSLIQTMHSLAQSKTIIQLNTLGRLTRIRSITLTKTIIQKWFIEPWTGTVAAVFKKL